MSHTKLCSSQLLRLQRQSSTLEKKLSVKETSLLFHEESPCPRLYNLDRFPGCSEDQDVCQKRIKNIRTYDCYHI